MRLGEIGEPQREIQVPAPPEYAPSVPEPAPVETPVVVPEREPVPA